MILQDTYFTTKDFFFLWDYFLYKNNSGKQNTHLLYIVKVFTEYQTGNL